MAVALMAVFLSARNFVAMVFSYMAAEPDTSIST